MIYAPPCHSLISTVGITPNGIVVDHGQHHCRIARMVRYQFTPDSVLSPEPIKMGTRSVRFA